jgi:hypothetical protein
MQLAEVGRRPAAHSHRDKASPSLEVARPGSALSSLMASDLELSYNFLEESIDFSAMQ